MIPKIAFIDSLVNSSYLMKEMSSTIDIAGIFTVESNKVKICDPVNNQLTHVTLCSKIFCNRVKSKYSLYYINIFESDGQKANISNLLVALQWCIVNRINIINLSIGSTSQKDIPMLFDAISEITNQGIVVVAACSNNGKMTFPAFFHNVISVKAIENTILKGGFSFKVNSIDRINAGCYVNEEEILYNDLSYKIYSSNSYATPIITAQICNYMNSRTLTMKEIISKLSKDAVCTFNEECADTIKKVYCSHICIPVIAVVYDTNCDNDIDIKMQLVRELLKKFLISGYEGICLSDTFMTNILDHIFNIEEDNIYNLQEKLLLYSNYCDVSFLIVHIEKENIIKKIDDCILDIILLDEQLNLYNKRYVNIEIMMLNKLMNSSIIFDKLYRLLLD